MPEGVGDGRAHAGVGSTSFQELLSALATQLVKDPESDGARYCVQRGDKTVVPFMIDVQDGIAHSPLGVIDLSFHVDAAFREHPVYGE